MKSKVYIQALSVAICLAFALNATSVAAQKIHLKGTVSDKSEKEILFKYHGLQSEVNTLRDFRIKLKKGASFDTTLTLPSAGYYGVFEVYSQWSNLLYLTPGDNLEIRFNVNDGTKTVFKGVGAEANNYLANFTTSFYGSKGSSFLEGDKYVRDTYEQTCTVADSLTKVALNKLDKTKGVSESFRMMERGRIFAHLAYTYTSYFFHQKGLDFDNIHLAKKNFCSKIRPDVEAASKEFMSDNCIEHPEVRKAMKTCVVEDSILTVSPSSNVYEFLSLIAIKNVMVEECTPAVVAKANALLATFKNRVLADNLSATIGIVSKLLKGSNAFDIQLEDANGKISKLSDYKGKIIYVDFWATWCMPCIGETPHFSKLREKYDRSDVVFISISLDKKKDSWKRFIEKEKSSAVQYIAKDIKKVADDWQIKGIPRFLIIDKEFKIVNANAPRPSTGEIIESELNKML